MIPRFPNSKAIELEDKTDVELITGGYPPYSDFVFASLWAWDTAGSMRLSVLRGALVIRFADYLTGAPFFTFMGGSDANSVAENLLEYEHKNGLEQTLKLIPEECAKQLDHDRFEIIEDHDHFDYMYDIHSHTSFSHPKLKTARNSLSAHKRKHPSFSAARLNLADPNVRTAIADLAARWEKNKSMSVVHDQAAFARFLAAADTFPYVAVGISHETILTALSISVRTERKYCSCLFSKADTAYQGIYALLMHETAKILSEKGFAHMNYEQDLGILGLRKAKQSFHPTVFLKKYIVLRKQ